MKHSILLGILFTALTAFGTSAQTTSRAAAHKAAHSSQLANHKNSLDISVVDKLMEREIKEREEAMHNHLSEETSGMLSDLIKEANKHLGKRYRAGSKGPNTFDCSGFSSYVYRQFGYTLSPSSRAQYTQGEKVNRKELRTGDLVFFTSRRSGKNVGHVGIVTEANNETGDFKFIHAATSGIRVDKCSGSGYYEGRYLGARRIITE